jgi:hypothetical protein
MPLFVPESAALKLDGPHRFTRDQIEAEARLPQPGEAGWLVDDDGNTDWVDELPTLSCEQLDALHSEAAAAGDLEQAALCERALGGDVGALRACVKAVRAAAAMAEGAS